MARDFFHQIHFPGDIHPERRHGNSPAFAVRSFDLKSQAAQDALLNQCGGAVEGQRRHLDIGAPLEAVRCFRVHPLGFRSAADRHRLKPRAFEQNCVGARGNFGFLPTHNTRQSHGVCAICDDQIIAGQGAVHPVESSQWFARLGAPHDNLLLC